MVDLLEGTTTALWSSSPVCQKSTWRLRRAAREATGNPSPEGMAVQDHVDYAGADPEQPPFPG